jgi:hypothetical protein
MSFVRTRHSRRNYGWPIIEIDGTIVRYGRFSEHQGQWPMLRQGVYVRIAEWSSTKVGAEREALAFCLGATVDALA